MRLLSLFSGVGAFDVALAPWCETVAGCDIDPFVVGIFTQRIGAPVIPDVREIDAGVGPVEVVAGGFPCQPVSHAGLGLAQKDERWLWPEFRRVIEVLQPRLVFIENVPGLRKRGLVDVLSDLAALGYDAEWDGIPAAAVGAPHVRDRVWIVAYRDGREVFGRSWEMLGRPIRLAGAKVFRAGLMVGGGIFPLEPCAPVKTVRRDGWSYWNGVQLAMPPNAALGLWPTPRASGGASSSGGGEGGTYYRTPSQEDGSHGRYLQSEVCELEARAGRERGPLNPAWVEWLMGLPCGWTDPETPNEALAAAGWAEEPFPRVLRDVPQRKERLQACGNALVWQVARYVAARAFAHELEAAA